MYKYGEVINVRDHCGSGWLDRKFVALLPNGSVLCVSKRKFDPSIISDYEIVVCEWSLHKQLSSLEVDDLVMGKSIL